MQYLNHQQISPRRLATTLTLLIGLCLAAPTAADPAPAADTLPLTGALTTAAGGPVSDGAYGIEVTLFADAALQQVVYQQAFVGVEVASGRFAVTLGEGPLAPPFVGVDIAEAAALVQIKVDAEPPLPPVALHPVLRAYRAAYADDAGTAQVALSAQNANKAALADKAMMADAALLADTALLADKATLADAALIADLASVADEAKVANTAFSLQCTGCVGAEAIAPAALAGMASLTADNGFSGANTFAGPTAFGQDVAFENGAQAKLLRLQNSTEDPVACTAATIGTIYYDNDDQALRVCNGQVFQPFAKAIPLGEEGNPAVSCQAIVDANPASATGNYWVDPDGAAGAEPFAVRCEVSGGEGWFAITFANSQGVVMAEDSGSNPWRKCADDGAKHLSFISEGQVNADASGSSTNHDITLSYTNPATGQAFTAAQLDAIRGVISELGADTRMVATTADDDGYSKQAGETSGHEVYIKGTSGQWTLLTPGTNGECGGSSDWPAGGSQAAHYLWHHTAALSIADGWTTQHTQGVDNATSADLLGLAPGDLIPTEVRLAIFTGGGAAFGFEKQTFRVR